MRKQNRNPLLDDPAFIALVVITVFSLAAHAGASADTMRQAAGKSTPSLVGDAADTARPSTVPAYYSPGGGDPYKEGAVTWRGNYRRAGAAAPY